MNETRITKSRKRSQILDLSVEQQNAVPLILSGKSDREVAEAIGVARETVTRWRNSDPVFMARVNYERRVLWNFGRDKVLMLQAKALGVVERALDDGDTHAALAFLKMANCTDVEYEECEFDDNPGSVLMTLCMQEAEEQYLAVKRQEHAETDEDGRMSCLLDEEDRTYLSACRLYREKKAASEKNAGRRRISHPSSKRSQAEREHPYPSRDGG